MFKTRFRLFFLIIIMITFILLLYFATKQAKELRRDSVVLMNRYYLLKQSDPESARKTLLIILQKDMKNQSALNELIQLYLKENNSQAALPLLKQLHEMYPNKIDLILQIANLYYSLGDWKQAQAFLEEQPLKNSLDLKAQIFEMRMKMSSFIPNHQKNASIQTKAFAMDKAPSSFITIWLNYFYKIKNTNPQESQELLSLLNIINPGNTIILKELAYGALKKGKELEAIDYFLEVYETEPSPQIALQLAYLYDMQQNKEKASEFFLLASASNIPETRNLAWKGYANVHAMPESISKKTQIVSEEQLLMDKFYQLKKKNKSAAWILIQKIIQKYPKNSNALNEGGFLAVDLKFLDKAIAYFSASYQLTFAPDLAMQLGYLYAQINNNYLASHYFTLASRGDDKTLALRANNALTNIAGLQTKRFPPPYYGEFFFDPFSQTRFGLTVRPMVARLGIERNDYFQTKIYLNLRQTEDNKSANLGQIPQIYEDNVRITGAGLQIAPVKKLPVIAFIEAGGAYDLVYRNRNRWRGDLRSGLMYYQEFGAKPAFFDQLKFSTKYYSTVYGDATYFSRYHNNVIATLKTHQGIRLFQYHASMLNLYATGRVIEDTNRDFFNNIAEIGPGVGFVPNNRYAVQIRFEHVKGVYLPAGGSFNPYGKYYTNNTVQLFVYLKI